jgi:hypothetical protein
MTRLTYEASCITFQNVGSLPISPRIETVSTPRPTMSGNRDQRADPARCGPPVRRVSYHSRALSGFEGTGTQNPMLRATAAEDSSQSLPWVRTARWSLPGSFMTDVCSLQCWRQVPTICILDASAPPLQKRFSV